MSLFVFRLAAVAACVSLAGVAFEGSASAYSLDSAVSAGCHERISMEALRRVRKQLATAPSIEPKVGDDIALISDVPFKVDDDMKDVASVAFLIGVRDNDLKGRGAAEIEQLAAVHGNPDNQREHCLRSAEDEEPGGTIHALETCQAFIRGKILEAIDALDGNGAPEAKRLVNVDIVLSLRGAVTVGLPAYWVRMGQAVHTMQDSFTHTFRTPDRMRVRTVLNWLKYVDGTDIESRDGPVHRNGLDQCDNLDELRTLNLEVATQASVELMRATLDPTLTREAKLAAVDATLAKYLTYEPGCTEANGWCDAPERQYQVAAGCGCSVLGPRSGGLIAAGACALGIGFLVARRRRRRIEGLAALPVALACLCAPAIAHAQPTPTTTTTTSPTTTPPPPPSGAVTTDAQTGAAVATDANKPPPGVPTTTEAKAEKIEKEHRSFFGVYVAGSGSVTNPGVSGQLGVRFRLSELVTVGADGEVNGWYGIHTGRLRTGAFNAYGTGIFHYPLRFQQVNLRTTLNLGISTMLIDLYGAPRGTTGLFLGVVPLGLEWKVSKVLYVIFDVLGVALPIPQLTGAPFAYPQYRTAVGIELAF